MELCDNDHDEVCFDCRFCPVCKVIDEIDGLEDTITDLNDEVNNLKEEIDNG